jgi:putative ABC transport system permease protein
MLAITFYDLRFRGRQFLIAVVGAALVFSLGLLESGLANNFHVEVNRLIRGIGADWWIIPHGSSGPLTSLATLPDADLQAVRAAPGVVRADPLIFLPESAVIGKVARSTEVIGHELGALGDEPVDSGRRVQTQGEAVVDARLHVGLGRTFAIAGRPFTVVGLTHGHTVNGGVPTVSMLIGDTQALAFSGQLLQTTIVTQGRPSSLPPGLLAKTNAEVRSDTIRPLKAAVASIDNSRQMMWVVAAIIIAALLYVSALERVRDFAVLKSLGSSSGRIFAGLVVQSVLVTIGAAVLAAVAAIFLKPIFPLPVTIPGTAYIVLPAVAIGVGVIASLVALRRAVGVDPTLAFSSQ